MKKIQVHAVAAKEVIGVRWSVLRPGLPRKTAIFEGDDDDDTCHLGGFIRRQLVGVASIYRVAMPERTETLEGFQLRGMATLPEVRGAGVGRELLTACEDAARQRGAHLIWCNARTSAADFYRKHGWQVVGAEFDIPTVGPHYRMFRELR